MIKYEYDQLPSVLNMFLLRIDLCIITILEPRKNSALLLLSMHTETETFDLLVSMLGIIYVTSFVSFKRILKKCILSEKNYVLFDMTLIFY